MTDSTVTIDPAPIPPISEEQAQHAARVVAGAAHDADDAAMLLAALGLLDGGRIVAPRVPIDVRNIKNPKDMVRGRR